MHGVIGFIGAVNKLLSQVQPSHVIAVFDGETTNPRKQIEPDYKANRPNFCDVPDAENPFSQLPLVYKALDEMHITRYETVDCEADDVIAAYALQAQAHSKVVIASFDSDFFQLISDNVSVFRYRGKSSVLADEHYLQQRLGVAPREYALFKALCGDQSDNLTGVSGIGPKNAARLVHGCTTPNELFAKLAVSEGRIATLALQNESLVRHNYRLIKLNADTSLPLTIDSLHAPTEQRKTMDVLRAAGIWN